MGNEEGVTASKTSTPTHHGHAQTAVVVILLPLMVARSILCSAFGPVVVFGREDSDRSALGGGAMSVVLDRLEGRLRGWERWCCAVLFHEKGVGPSR